MDRPAKTLHPIGKGRVHTKELFVVDVGDEHSSTADPPYLELIEGLILWSAIVNHLLVLLI
jgi:hypothetical protein